MSGATMASAPFSNAIGTSNLAIRGGAAARAGGKTWHAARRPYGRSGSRTAVATTRQQERYASYRLHSCLNRRLCRGDAAIATSQPRQLTLTWKWYQTADDFLRSTNSAEPDP